MDSSCRICRNKTNGKTDGKGRLYHFCPHCGFVCLDSRFYLSSIEQKNRYELHNNSLENTGYVKWLEKFICDAVVPWIDKGLSILDYGSGPNPVLKDLLSRKGYVTNHYDKFFYPNNIRTLFDMITSTEVVEHVEDPVSFLKEILNYLKPNGLIAIKTQFFTNNIGDFFSWWYREDSTHISFFSLKTFSILADLLNIRILFNDNDSVVIFKS